MVDLVKIRKKAKEKQQARAEEDAAASQLSTPSAPPAPEVTEGPAEALPSPLDAAPSAPSHPEAPPERPAWPEVAPSSAAEKLERFKRTAGERETVAASDLARQQKDEEQQVELLTFLIGDEQYAVDIEQIVEIIPPRVPTRVPNAPTSIGGVISLRGTMVTLINVGKRLGHGGQPDGIDARVVVVESAGGAAGFLVDRVLRVIKVDPAAITSHPVVTATEQREYIRGVFQQDKAVFILLDLVKLLQD